MVMAIEAMKQLAELERVVTGVRLRRISLKKMLVVPDTQDGIQTAISLRRITERGDSSAWHEFRITSYYSSSGTWSEYCTGMIVLEYETATGPVDGGREARLQRLISLKGLRRWENTTADGQVGGAVYEAMHNMGFQFGPNFLMFSGAKVDLRTPTTTDVAGFVTIPNVAATMPSHFLHPHIIHPATMDNMVHAMFPVILGPEADPLGQFEGAAVPSFIEELWVSGAIDKSPGHRFKVHCQGQKLGAGQYVCDIRAWDDDIDDHVLDLKGVRTSPLQSTPESSQDS
jgi:hypothetical protein